MHARDTPCAREAVLAVTEIGGLLGLWSCRWRCLLDLNRFRVQKRAKKHVYRFIFIYICIRTYSIHASPEEHSGSCCRNVLGFERKENHILSNCASATGCKNVLRWQWSQFNKLISSNRYPAIESPSFISEFFGQFAGNLPSNLTLASLTAT